MSTVRTNNILDASGGNTATINSMTPTADSLQGFRNRIINGAMVIDQRNAGASVTPASLAYTLDRWRATMSATSARFSVQQNAGSVTPPAGFTNYLGVTSLSAHSLAAGDQYGIQQWIEGFNIADLGWGTANAKTVTLSFWVRSSLTGTFGGSLWNSGGSRSYPFTFTINSANTWEFETITIAGDTSGTWLTDSSRGIGVLFGLGVGSTYSGTAGSWSGSTFTSATGATSVVGTNGATFYITGVQLEVGSVATPFERRDYGRELMLCQRYYQKVFLNGNGLIGFADTTTASINMYYAPTTMRGTPTLSTTGTAADYQIRRPGASSTCSVVPSLTSTSSDYQNFRVLGTVASGLTAGDGNLLNNAASEVWLAFSSEL
jgi:hypothetical protein